MFTKKLQIDLNISPNFKIYGDGGLLARVLNNILKMLSAIVIRILLLKLQVKKREK